MTETVDARYDPESGDDDEELVELQLEDMYEQPFDDFDDPIDLEDDRFEDVELVRSCSNILQTPSNTSINKAPASFNRTPAPVNKAPASFNRTPAPINIQRKTNRGWQVSAEAVSI